MDDAYSFACCLSWIFQASKLSLADASVQIISVILFDMLSAYSIVIDVTMFTFLLMVTINYYIPFR